MLSSKKVEILVVPVTDRHLGVQTILVTSADIRNRVIVSRDPENMSVAFGIIYFHLVYKVMLGAWGGFTPFTAQVAFFSS